MELIGLHDCERAELYSSQMFNKKKERQTEGNIDRFLHVTVFSVCLFVCDTWYIGVTRQEDIIPRCSREEAALTSLSSFTPGL